MAGARRTLIATLTLALALDARAQMVPTPSSTGPEQLNESGRVVVEGHSIPYLIRRLPLNAFPQLPSTVVEELKQRDCRIPQTYEAHQPENVVHASLERAGSQDWAVLCSAQGTVSLLVFFGSSPQKPLTLASVAETDRLQRFDSSGVLGFNWGIDPASPQHIHDAQIGLTRRPPTPDHDALADSTIENRTVYHFYLKGKWTLLDVPED